MGTSPYLSIAAIRRALGALLLCAAVMASVPAAAQQARTAGRTEAIVLRPLAFFKVDDLHLGDILPSTSTAGTVRLFPNGTRTATGGITLFGNNHQVARFTGLGTNNQIVSISLQSNTITLTGPGTPMTVRNFEIGSTPTVLLSTTPLRFRLSSVTGAFNFPVGATIDVAANQAAGDYTGSFTIILVYQ